MRRNNAMGHLGARTALVSALPVVLLGLCLFLGGLRAFDAPPARAAGWVTLADELRVTFYGPHYVAGDVTASGIRYAPDDDIVALGPDLLALVRAHYARVASEAGLPPAWTRLPGGRIAYRGFAGAFPVMVSWREAVWWGHWVRLCAGAAGGGELCRELRVADTGLPALEVDLPDETWQEWGWPAGRGVFAGRLEVLE